MFKKIFVTALLAISFIQLGIAQIYDPVKWSYSMKETGNDEVELTFKATIEKNWHLYSQFLPSDDGPIATSFNFDESASYKRLGKVEESKSVTKYDKVNAMELTFFEDEAVFTQKIKKKTGESFVVSGYLEFMVCDDEKCLPPDSRDFEFSIEGESKGAGNSESDALGAAGEGAAGDSESMVAIGGEDNAEVYDPVKWSISSSKSGENEYEVTFNATIEKGWHLYSQKIPEEDGPIPTAFYFDELAGVELNGDVEELGDLISEYDPNFMMDLDFFADAASFKQIVKINGSESTIVSGELEFMVCNDKMCLPPELLEFKVDLTTGTGKVGFLEAEGDDNTDVTGIIPQLSRADLENPLGDCGEKKEISNVWLVFLFGFIGGLIALLTPCVFPMIPLTVSFFTKGHSDKSGGLGKATLYGVFILLIYASLSIPFHFNTDPEVLNEVATSVWLNVVFFLVFVVFAISFFGYFEITLPSNISNKADSASDVGGIVGIFFMALTLALVSFSCTGPILGTVLGNSLKNGPWPITAAMSGFGLALGLPFAFFAAFPGIMNKLPQSGGWLNSVKVVLGFVELALALKFLSNADLVEQWGFIKRETFFLIWTIIGIALSAYLLGWIRFPHDSPRKKPSLFKVAFTSIIILFTIYIAPGVMRNSPWNHNLLSGFPPPMFYSWYEKETFHAEFMDFDEAMKEAKHLNKPLLIDFTGWACVNCRKMEESVWTVESVKERLKNDFVLVSLYVDDKVKLPEEQQGVFEYMVGGEVKKKKIRTIGNKWATFQTHVFNNNSQPYYVMLSPEGELLGNPVGYTPDVDEYEKYLDCGVNAFNVVSER